jgi:ankyrin repeat protein
MTTEYHHIGTPREGEDQWEMMLYPVNKVYVYYKNQETVKFCPELCSSPFEAIFSGDLEWIHHYVALGGDYDVTGPDQRSLMHYAAALHRQEFVETLFDKMKNPHASDVFGTSPLGIAARYGHLEILRLLISNGANVRAADLKGNTVLHEAAKFGQTHCVKFLLSLITSERYRDTFGLLVRQQNNDAESAYDVALLAGYSDAAALILTYM